MNTTFKIETIVEKCLREKKIGEILRCSVDGEEAVGRETVYGLKWEEQGWVKIWSII